MKTSQVSKLAIGRRSERLELRFLVSWSLFGSLFSISNSHAFSFPMAPVLSKTALQLSSRTTTAAAVASSTAIVVLDGAEWKSVLQTLRNQGLVSALGADGLVQSQTSTSKQPYGTMLLQTGYRRRNNDNISNNAKADIDDTQKKPTSQWQRVIGMVAPASVVVKKSHPVIPIVLSPVDNNSDSNPETTIWLYRDSVAVIPDNISNTQAASTLVHAIPLHCALPAVEAVGGSPDSRLVMAEGARIVVLGGHDLAVQYATALSTMQCQVTLVSTNNKVNIPKTKNANNAIRVMTPAVGEMELGFASVLGEFDALIDTIGDELGGGIGGFATDGSSSSSSSSVVRLLASQHKCSNYFSTLTQQQATLAKQGVLFGPNQAKQHVNDITRAVSNLVQPSTIFNDVTNTVASPKGSKTGRSSRLALFPPPRQLGDTVTILLQAGIVNFPPVAMVTTTVDNTKLPTPFVRGWTLPQFWEGTTWPRDSAGAGTVRFGLPVIDDLESDLYLGAAGLSPDQVAVSELDEPVVMGGGRRQQQQQAGDKSSYPDEDDEEGDGESSHGESSHGESPGSAVNPHIIKVVGIKGLQENIIEPKLDCILFLSAPFCRTCRYLMPQYQRWARLHRTATGGDGTTGAAAAASTTSPSLSQADDEDKVISDARDRIAFAKAEAAGPVGKELGKVLGIDAVPAFVMFKKGKRYGRTLSVSKLPSKQLEKAVLYVETGLKWDNNVFLEAREADSADSEGFGKKGISRGTKLKY